MPLILSREVSEDFRQKSSTSDMTSKSSTSDVAVGKYFASGLNFLLERRGSLEEFFC